MRFLVAFFLVFVAAMEHRHPKTVQDYVDNDTIRFLYLKECSHPTWKNAGKCAMVNEAERIKHGTTR